jgi:peptide/nickel transport system substrate-binding protein
MHRIKGLIVVVAAVALFATACGSSSKPSSGGTGTTGSSGSVSAGSVKEGGSASIIAVADAPSLDPTTVINSDSQGSTVMDAIYGVLFTTDAAGNVQPGLATSFSSPDGLTWTLKLRPGLKFSDGTPFDANAVKAQWTSLAGNPESGATWAALKYFGVTETVVDPQTLQVVLKTVDRQFEQLVPVTNLEWIPSPTAKAAEGANFSQKPVGAGPFLLQSRIPNVDEVLVRNPGYWESGYPKLDTLTIKIIGDPTQAQNTFDTNEADASLIYTAQTAEQKGYSVSTLDQIGGNCWLFGTSSAPFNNIQAREAVYDAIDMNQLDQDVFQGKEPLATSLFPKGTPFYNPNISFPPTNKAEAQTLFNQLAAEGKPVKFTIIGTPGNMSWMVDLQTQLDAFKNVSVSVKALNASTYGITLYTGAFQLAVYGVGGLDPEPSVEGFRSNWPLPIASMGDPKIDADLTAGIQATTLAGRQAAYNSLQTDLNAQYRILWQSASIFDVVEHKNVTGLQLYGQGSVLLDDFGFVS